MADPLCALRILSVLEGAVHDDRDIPKVTGHILPTRVYYTIFGVLMLATYVTVQIAFLDLGVFNAVVALTIAVLKAVLVVLFFMHVRYSTRLTWVVVIAAVFWLVIMLALTAGDYLTRSRGTFG